MNIKSKGQVISLDFIISILIVFIILAYINDAWNTTTETSRKYLTSESIKKNILITTDFLVNTPGYPDNWEKSPSNVNVIGLAKNDRIINQDKLDAFLVMDYDELKSKLNTGGWEFYFKLKTSDVTYGLNPTSDNVVFMRRIVLYNGIVDTLEFYLWK